MKVRRYFLDIFPFFESDGSGEAQAGQGHAGEAEGDGGSCGIAGAGVFVAFFTEGQQNIPGVGELFFIQRQQGIHKRAFGIVGFFALIIIASRNGEFCVFDSPVDKRKLSLHIDKFKAIPINRKACFIGERCIQLAQIQACHVIGHIGKIQYGLFLRIIVFRMIYF